jgi:hypothetical protein
LLCKGVLRVILLEESTTGERGCAQTAGPIAYGYRLGHFGKMPTLFAAAGAMIALGFACARLLKQRLPADANERPDVGP